MEENSLIKQIQGKVVIPEQIFSEMPVTVGTFLKSQTTTQDSQVEEVIFVLKEETDTIASLLAKNPCQIKHGIFRMDDVYLVIVMFYIWNTIYETWWNYHDESGEVKECFWGIATQDQFRIFFVTESKRIWGGIPRKNELKEPFKKYLETLKETTPWAIEAFDQAKEEIYRRFPSKENLWDAL